MAARLRTVMWKRLFQMSAGSGMSLQGQIREMLVSTILDGQLPVDIPLPSSRELAEQLGVARNTVVLAYQQLADEGYLLSRERSGHFVNPEILCGNVARQPRDVADAALMPDWSRRFRFRPSSQRNIVKPPDWQKYPYPFIYGQFDPAHFPIPDWRECCVKALGVIGISGWASDLIANDDPSLIEQIRTRVLPRRGVWAAADEIIITVGAQQALYLLADLLLTAGSVIGIEDPGYPDARNIFACRTPHLRGIRVDGDGLMLTDSLRQCDYVMVTPSHQCPTTTTMPLERREALLRLAEAADFVVIEDDYESENSFAANPTAALKSLDRSDRVIYIGSLSKTFAPGLRLGYIVGPRELVREARALRRLMLRHPSAFIQRSFANFLALGHHDALLRRQAVAYRERAHALCAAVHRHLPDTEVVPASGGASCWVSGPQWLDTRVLADAASQRGILIEPGDVFFMSEDPPRNHMRLGFSSIDAEKIDAGIRELGAVMCELADDVSRASETAAH
ncbi:MAG TPA: PLP-dependent aminotransferase family protein [Burkholderiales bacterium]|nr:PLP-dependent aminotransferase family protein [Burkholderiales bacterium]